MSIRFVVLEVLNQIEAEVLEERDLQRGQMEKQWGQLLLDRVESGRALGKLEIASIDHSHKLIHFIPPREDFAFLKEQQRVRISQDSPAGHHFGGIFYGLTEQGLTVRCTACDQLDFEQIQGWTIDEDFVDVSDFYLRGLKQLAESAHGRETVFPILFEEQAATIDAETFDDTYDALDESESPLNDSQKDAVATALAASPMHLIQGPPGTGKTQTLARLVERLFIEGHRVLVTGFTHRSIDNALSKIQDVLNGQCPVVKVGAQVSNETQNFPRYDTLEESGLSDCQGPHV
ncbi:MAG: AAA domain-containing protein, partial [Rubritalea sp.]|uniref:AAA domain-containing protein n=1 Tax=Rubritalea sp. TaxID=2109375 RepID=UPI0032425ACA